MAMPSPSNWSCTQCKSIQSGPRRGATDVCTKCATEEREVKQECTGCGTVSMKPDQFFCHHCGKSMKAAEGTSQNTETGTSQSADNQSCEERSTAGSSQGSDSEEFYDTFEKLPEQESESEQAKTKEQEKSHSKQVPHLDKGSEKRHKGQPQQLRDTPVDPLTGSDHDLSADSAVLLTTQPRASNEKVQVKWIPLQTTYISETKQGPSTEPHLVEHTRRSEQQTYYHRSHKCPSSDLEAFKAPSDKSIAVTFHAIIPRNLWGWDDTSHVHIRFEGSALGNWKHNVGVFQPGRELDCNSLEMKCTLQIDSTVILKKPLAYKYVIFSPPMSKEDDCYEYLHSLPGQISNDNPNRCIWIIEDNGGEYHQYDCVVYPRTSKGVSKSFLGAGVEYVTSFLTNRVKGQEEFDAMAKKCLNFYLEPYKKQLLNGEYPQHLKVDHLVESVVHVYRSHRTTCVKNKDSAEHVKNKDSAEHVPNECTENDMRDWFAGTVTELHNLNNPRRQFISSACIACCIVQCNMYNLFHVREILCPLLRMLHIQLDERKRVCLHVSCLFQTSHLFRSSFASVAFHQLCVEGIRIKGNLEWIHVLPLWHFMKGVCKPFAEPDYDPTKINFNARASELGLDLVNKKSYHGLVENEYSALCSLFDADPPLLHIFVYLCRKEEFPSLFKKIPAYLSLTRLSQMTRPNTSNDAKEWLGWLSYINEKITEELGETHSFNLTTAAVHGALLLFSSLVKQYTASYDRYLDLLKKSIIVALLALSKQKAVASFSGRSQMTGVFETFEHILKEMIVKFIGGSFFGGKIQKTELVYAQKELKLWQSLLELKIQEDQEIADRWDKTIEAVIRRRVTEVPIHPKIGLVSLLETNSHPIFLPLFVDGGIEALDKLFFDQPAHFNFNLEQMANVESKRVGILFGQILMRQYPQLDQKDVTLVALLNWSYWPIFIKIHVGSSKLKEGMPSRCLLACAWAFSKLDETSGQLESGSIRVCDLQIIEKNLQQMKRLLKSAYAQPIHEGSSVDKSSVDQRIEELVIFRKQQHSRLHLCKKLSSSIMGVTDAQRELQANYDSESINQLCQRSGDMIVLTCFQSSTSLQRFAQMFWTMTQAFNSVTFESVWFETMKIACANNHNISISDVCSLVWEPTFGKCKQLMEQLHDMSMTLSDVDKHFHHFKRGGLKKELENLVKGIDICCGEPKDPSWIQQAAERIEKYWKLCNQCEAANSFLKLRDTLKLTGGDFSLVEKISSEVSSSLKNQQTIGVISEKQVSAGKLLSEFSGPKLECIERFCDCQDVVQWIKDTTADISELQNFVNVALATEAGQKDALAQDKLSNLRTVGSGFGSLIYKMKGNTGFVELSKRCASVWTALKNNPALPHMLDGCNKDLEWYKSVKETQGSVGVTSFGQMNNILCYGHYIIGGVRGKTVHNIHDVIHLKLEESEKKLSKKSYNLDELRDLESKLVLITGSKAENRGEVYKFLDTLHCVCRIAEVLVSLQQAGNVRYIRWKMEFHCQAHLVQSLQEYASEMEEELKKWNRKVKSARNEFYELNYYTTRQLLVLRSELGKLKLPTSAPNHGQYQVMALLQSVSCETTQACIEKAVENKAERASDNEESRIFSQSGATDAILDSSTPASHQPPVTGSLNDNSENIFLFVDDHSFSVEKENTKKGLSVCDLNEKQKENFKRLTERIRCPKEFALKAIEECSNGEEWFEILKWVDEHEDELENMMESGIKEESEKGKSDEGEEEQDSPDTDDSLSVKSQNEEVVDEDLSKVHSQMVKVVHKEIVDDQHYEVQQLLEMGVRASLDDRITAIEKWETAEEALEHLLPAEGEDGTFELQAPVQSEKLSLQSQSKVEQIITVFEDPNAERKYLMLEELGQVLKHLSSELPAAVSSKRKFALLSGRPNLLVVAPEEVLRAALSLYMSDKKLPMPTPEEILICNEHTTCEEVNLLWQRAVCDTPHFRRVFCLVHAEKLPYQTADKALRSLNEIMQGRTDYRLVIICSNKEEEKFHIISKLHIYRRHYTVSPDITDYQQYLQHHFVADGDTHHQTKSPMIASRVDQERTCVRVVTSTRAGMGKSLFITRMAEQLRILKNDGSVIVTIPIHGPHVTADTVMECLVTHQDDSCCTILHFDIAPSVLHKVDTILFSLLIQRGLCDSQGRVWRNQPCQLYAIEVTLPEDTLLREGHFIPESCTMALLKILPCVHCVKPKEALSHLYKGIPQIKGIVLVDKQELESPQYKRVCHYLSSNSSSSGTQENPLQIIVNDCGTKDPSWAELRRFVSFLDKQLESCEQSVFFNEKLVEDAIFGLKNFVVRFMIEMSRDFATSSLRGEVAQENEEEMLDQELDETQQYQIAERKQWEQSTHPYIFFNKDGVSITFVGFRVTPDGHLIHPIDGNVLKRSIMTHNLFRFLQRQGVDFNEDYRTWTKDEMIRKICTVMGIDSPSDPDETYVLTSDNLIKILAIQMRFRCDIPVVIMGETGCGKTRLIRFMCDLAAQGKSKGNLLILRVHGGVKEKDVEKFLDTAKERAEENRRKNLETVVFFDEANTTEAIGLIKEIMCDRRLHGKPIPNDFKFVAACNPYRRHSEEMIEKLRAAGLGFYVKERDTQQKLGKIPLRELVYRVIDLPPSMKPLVYDYGQLNMSTESDYINQIVHDHMKTFPHQKELPAVIKAVAIVLTWSQTYMRKRNDECSFVSLRDVERAMIVFKYFFEKMDLFGPLMDKYDQNDPPHMEEEEQDNEYAPTNGDTEEPEGIEDYLIDTDTEDEVMYEGSEDEVTVIEHAVTVPQSDVGINAKALTWSLVLAISVCYHARLNDRAEFENGVAESFTPPLSLGGVVQFRNVIRWCQEVLLENMELGENIARNAALRENIFMMAICIDLRIPLFLVGKPGSSKSLAKAIVANAMQGQDSSSNLLKSFKQVHMFSYQCSQLSTPEGVIEVFNTAKRFQRDQNTDKYVSVVVLDEVGLAEDSQNLPLKVLHPLLEDGTKGANEEIIEREKRVAFIGISNWALDPAKMNRGVMVMRCDPNGEELELSARGICSNDEKDPVKNSLEPYFKPLAEAYIRICHEQKRQFFGLRDFYSLIKMLYWMCKKTETNMPLTGPQLLHAIKRNFEGLEDSDLDPVAVFCEKLKGIIHHPPDLSTVPKELHPFVSPDISKQGLIKASLRNKEQTWHGENRYLLFITENYAALEILKQYIKDQREESTSRKEHFDDSTEEILHDHEEKPQSLLGSDALSEDAADFALQKPSPPSHSDAVSEDVADFALQKPSPSSSNDALSEDVPDSPLLCHEQKLHPPSSSTASLEDTSGGQSPPHGSGELVECKLTSTLPDNEGKSSPLSGSDVHSEPVSGNIHQNQQSNKVPGGEEHLQDTETGILEPWKMEPFILFGSSFPRDKEYTQVCRNINQIKICMETGRTVILLNLDNLYESLYDVLNQYYIYHGGSRYVDLGLQTHRVKCRVHEEFKLILIAEKTIVYKTFPTPLINRLEKHIVLASSVLEEWQSEVLITLQTWVENFSHISSSDTSFTEKDAFVGYHKDTPAAIVFQASNQLQQYVKDHKSKEKEEKETTFYLWEEVSKSGLLKHDMDELLDVKMGSEKWKEAVLAVCQFLLLMTTSPAALTRLQQSSLSHDYQQLNQLYIQQHHTSIDDFLSHCVTNDKSVAGLLLQVTTHSHLLSFMEVQELSNALSLGESGVASFLLQEFDTELDFTTKLSPFFVQEENKQCLLIIQCDFNHVDDSLIACACYCIYNIRAKALLNSGPKCTTHVLFIIHVPVLAARSSFKGFQGGPWVCCHIDELRGSSDISLTLEAAQGTSISVLFCGKPLGPASDQKREDAPATYSQCTRLHSCIQAAASRLQDSFQNKQRATKRVEVLTRLIPSNSSFPLDAESFHGILVDHIHRLLKERERVFVDRNWVLEEAMSICSLHSGGTFKNVLARKLDDVIIPILAQVIAFLDHNCNLSLLHVEDDTTPLFKLWLRIFQSPVAQEYLSYEQMVSTQKVIMAKEEFECKFPFFWLVKDTIDVLWDNAKGVAGASKVQQYQRLRMFVNGSTISEVLGSVKEENCEDLYQSYLHDFVKTVHKHTHKNSETGENELKLITDSLHSIIVQGPEFSPTDGRMTLIDWVAAVHVVYSFTCEEVHWFGQLTSFNPDIVSSLLDNTSLTFTEEGNMVLHLHALDKVIDSLEPPINAERNSSYSEEELITKWLQQLHLASNTIISTLSLPSQHSLATKTRNKWHMIKVIQMFAEHVILKHNDMVPYARMLQVRLRREPNFLKHGALKRVKGVLMYMYKILEQESEHPRSKERTKYLLSIRKCCSSFFMEVISGLCFGQSVAPEDELVEMLIDIVFNEMTRAGQTQPGTRMLTPYDDELKKSDKNPVIRSFLLQLLLEHKYVVLDQSEITDKVRSHLNNYFTQSQKALSSEGADQDLYLLCIQCFEDALHKRFSRQPLSQKQAEAVNLLKGGLKSLADGEGSVPTNVTLNFLEGVANVRFALLHVADLLQGQLDSRVDVAHSASKTEGEVEYQLLKRAKEACTNMQLNTIDLTGEKNTTGPVVYLMKLIVRQWGFHCLNSIVEKHEWVVPVELRQSEDAKTLDPFVIYNPTYASLREMIHAAMEENTYDELTQKMEVLQTPESVSLVLALYGVLTLGRTNTLLSAPMLSEILEKCNELILNCKVLSKELQVMARVLIANEQGGPLSALQVSPKQPANLHTLRAVAVHTVVTLFSGQNKDILKPLVDMLIKPANLTKAYLPTMPEDMLPEARKLITDGQFWECPRGHPYFVGDCGRPWVKATCNVCGSDIGGAYHKPADDNKPARTNDATQMGHCLGPPNRRSIIPSPERSMSAAACNIVRAIMHSALLWASCNNESTIGELVALVKPTLPANELPEFFWGHLEKDLQLLSKALGKNVEEAAIVVHLILRHITTSDRITRNPVVKNLHERSAREEWEKLFYSSCIQPVLEYVDNYIEGVMEDILRDDKQDHNMLISVTYEHVPVVPGTLEPHLWGYRPRISLFHLAKALQHQKGKYPVLERFLKEEPILRATQYLPDIVKMQLIFFNSFHLRVDRHEVKDKTIGQFIQSRKGENVRKECQRMFESIQKAWSLVGDKLREHARLRVDDKYLIPVMKMDTTLDFFIPTTTGPGACTFALADYLVLAHNDFVEYCKNLGAAKRSKWLEHKVPLTHIHRCHILDYESQIVSIILSNSHYSLQAGKGHDITYDFQSLQKHILHHYIFGKPTILVDIPQVVYRKDVYTATTFANIREKVKPQIPLPTQRQQVILQELSSPDLLRRSLDVVDIVLGFLSSSGGKPKVKIADYLKNLKMEERKFSEKAKEYCNLEHTLSLWQTLSVGLAKAVTLIGQEPFQTIPNDLMNDLTDEQKHGLAQCLQGFDQDSLLGMLFEFIETYVRHIDVTSSEKTWELVDTLVAHLDRNKMEVLPHLKELPRDITLAQAIATWKYIVSFHETQV